MMIRSGQGGDRTRVVDFTHRYVVRRAFAATTRCDFAQIHERFGCVSHKRRMCVHVNIRASSDFREAVLRKEGEQGKLLRKLDFQKNSFCAILFVAVLMEVIPTITI